MKMDFLAWFLFLLCIQSATILGFEEFPTSKFEDFNLSKPRFGEQRNGVNFTIGLYGESNKRKLKEKHEIFHSVKVKGKGNYGAGNEAHHPRTDKGAASLSPSKCFLNSKAMLRLSLALIGLLLPHFLTES